MLLGSGPIEQTGIYVSFKMNTKNVFFVLLLYNGLKQHSDVECTPDEHQVYTTQGKGWHGHRQEPGIIQCPPGAHCIKLLLEKKLW